MQYLVPKTDENIKLLMYYVDSSSVLGLERLSNIECIVLSYLPKKLKHLQLTRRSTIC